MAIWPAVLGLADGEYLEEDVLNRPTRQLRERTDWLRQRVVDLIGGDSYESLRLVDVPLTVGTDAEPDVKDFVYLNPSTRTYEKAVASADVVSNVFEIAKDSSYSVGILTSKSGGLGTIVISGKVTLGDSADWDLSTLLEADATFRSGPYYLSNSEVGKMMAEPSGPAIYLGFFTDNASAPGYGGYAILSPQYKDVGEAHVHRAFALASQPAGIQEISGTVPSAYHTIHGFTPTAQADVSHGAHAGADAATTLDPDMTLTLNNYAGVTIYNQTQGTSGVAQTHSTTVIEVLDVATPIPWDTDDTFFADARCRAVILGNYSGTTTTQYTLTLTDDTGVVGLSSGPVNGSITDKAQGFNEVYLKWESSDVTEVDGLVRITSYEVPVQFGTKGLSLVLENALESETTEQYWNWCEASSNDIDRRQWVIEAPEQTSGWRAKRVRKIFDEVQTTDNNYSLVLFGGPIINALGRFENTVNVAVGRMYAVTYTGQPADGDTLQIDNKIFEIDNNSSITAGNIAVTLGIDADTTYGELRDAIAAEGIEGVHVALDTATDKLILVVPVGLVVPWTLANASVSVITAGTGLALDGTAKMLVYDDDFNNLVTDDTYWDDVEYYTPVALKNGLRAMFIPFDDDATPAISDGVTAGDTWTAEIIDEAPSAVYEYAMGMDTELSRFYPALPLTAVTLTVNGIEQSNKLLHTSSPAYQAAFGTLYWFVNNYAQVPWPVDWVSTASAGSGDYEVHSTLYLAHMRMQDTSFVTSLQPAPGSVIRVLCCGTDKAGSTGDLMLDVDLNLSTASSNLAGYQVIKDVQGTQMLRGPVVSKINSGAGITITSRPGQPDGQGEVTIAASTGAGFSGEFDEIAMNNAKQEMIGMFPYIKLLGWQTNQAGNIPSGFTAKFRVPITVTGEFQVLVYLTVFGEQNVAYTAAGTNLRKHAGISMNYAVLRDYAPEGDTYGTLVDNLIQPVSARGLEIPLGKEGGYAYDDATYVYKAYDPMVVHNNPADAFDDELKIARALGGVFPNVGDTKAGTPQLVLGGITVQAGSLVAIDIQRAGVDDTANEYTDPIGFINLRWRLVEVSAT